MLSEEGQIKYIQDLQGRKLRNTALICYQQDRQPRGPWGCWLPGLGSVPCTRTATPRAARKQLQTIMVSEKGGRTMIFTIPQSWFISEHEKTLLRCMLKYYGRKCYKT